ncbi:class I SAM-dependent methyltransferase [Gryllotalpicola protaetiae]|nr:class I SAM-dependent methyltransferase [Gryllotalpicola protaetiae]
MRTAVARVLARIGRRGEGPGRDFDGSASYWESRYNSGGDSGAGSYGVVAEFKAQVLNDLIAEQGLQRVIEFGCGDGNQLGMLAVKDYVGLDVSPTVIAACRQRYATDRSKSFILIEGGNIPIGLPPADLALSLDVVYHLVEDEVYAAYMSALFDHSRRFVVVFAPNENRTDLPLHMRYRRFTDWVDAGKPDWRLARTIDNPHKQFPLTLADFYVFERRPGRS